MAVWDTSVSPVPLVGKHLSFAEHCCDLRSVSPHDFDVRDRSGVLLGDHGSHSRPHIDDDLFLEAVTLVLPRIKDVLLAERSIGSVDLDDCAVDNRRDDGPVFCPLVPEKNGVPCEWTGKPDRRVVDVVEDCRNACQSWKAHGLQRFGAVREKDKQKEKFVSVCVDEAWPSSSLEWHSVDDVESGVEYGLTDVQVGKHPFHAPIEKKSEPRGQRRSISVGGSGHAELEVLAGGLLFHQLSGATFSVRCLSQKGVAFFVNGFRLWFKYY